MRKLLFLFLVLTFAACSNLKEPSGPGITSACVSAPAPWIGLDTAPAPMDTSLGAAEPVLRAVTYNIHSGMGQWKGLWRSRATVQRHLDGIADAIAGTAPAPVDIVALNEVDFSARRSGGIDQARYLAEALERRSGARYHVIYGRTRERLAPGFDGSYGNAVLVRYDVSESKACLYDDTRACGIADAPAGMPGLRASGFLQRAVREARGIIKLTLDFHGHPVDVIVTHLEAVALQEREAQASHLLRRFVDPGRTTVVLGDMNAVPTVMTRSRAFAKADRTHDILTSGSLADARVLYDARLGRTDFRAWATYPANAPVWPLDTALGSLDLIPYEARVMDARDSDHRGFYIAYRVTRNGLLVDAQRSRHDAIRRRQLAQILACDIAGTRSNTLHWLRARTEFSGLSSVEATATPVPAL